MFVSGNTDEIHSKCWDPVSRVWFRCEMQEWRWKRGGLVGGNLENVFTYSQCQQNTWCISLSLGIFYTSCPKEVVIACRICIWTRAPKGGNTAERRSTVTLALWQTLWSLFLTIMPERWHINKSLVQLLIMNIGHWSRVLFCCRLKALDTCSIMTSLQRVTLPLHLATVKVSAAVFHLIASQTCRCNKTLYCFFFLKGWWCWTDKLEFGSHTVHQNFQPMVEPSGQTVQITMLKHLCVWLTPMIHSAK